MGHSPITLEHILGQGLPICSAEPRLTSPLCSGIRGECEWLEGECACGGVWVVREPPQGLCTGGGQALLPESVCSLPSGTSFIQLVSTDLGKEG